MGPEADFDADSEPVSEPDLEPDSELELDADLEAVFEAVSGADLEADLQGEDKRLIANPELASDSSYFEEYERKQATLNDFMTDWEVLEEDIYV